MLLGSRSGSRARRAGVGFVVLACVAAGAGCASSGDDENTSGAAGAGALSQPAGDEELAANRERLLDSYLAYLKGRPDAQSNGLAGDALTSTCDLWTKLAPSPQLVFLTLSARLQGAKMTDGGSMLDHVTKIYRIAGGDGSTATDHGSCGGGDANRMIMSMDAELQATLVRVNKAQGKESGKVLVHDIGNQSNAFWRDSHDLGGPHGPFDLSDETERGAPRGQVQFFRDPSSAKATAPLGRTDLTDVVDPLALEMDQDYDCPHNSNPACEYTSFQALCLPSAPKRGAAIYTDNYGAFSADWQPASCAK
jgi:hypothetical protein